MERLIQVDTESRVIDDAALRGDELRAIAGWLNERARMKPTGKTFFVSEQRKPLHRSTVNLLMKECNKAASLPLHVHPHMLRHACGYALADQGADTRLIRDYLGHREIQHTARCTATALNCARSASDGRAENCSVATTKYAVAILGGAERQRGAATACVQARCAAGYGKRPT